MSGKRVWAKVDWEGGLFDTAFGYGLRSSEISREKAPELRAAWEDMERAYRDHFEPAYERVHAVLNAMEPIDWDEEDDD
jgi:hypothetical protein